ncbi:MAG: histidine kinase, partial [Saprospiraceae bacterium]
MIIALGTFLVTWLVRFRIQQEKKKGEMKHQLLELEMRALRSQMNPHFIYNALNSIQSLVATQQSKLAGKYISIFGRLLRQVLENSKYNVIPLNRELETLHHYIDLEKLRLDSDVTYEEWIDPDLVPESFRIPPLILQPFVENALWHGLSTKEGEKKININITVANGFVLFSITDNGIGRQQSSQQKSTHAQHESFGIQVTAQRIDDFNGTGTDSQFHITDLQDTARQPMGTQVSFRVKCNTDPGLNL